MTNPIKKSFTGGQRILAIVLVAALLLGLVVTDQTLLRRRDAIYRGNEAYAYLIEHMPYQSDGFKRLYDGVSIWFVAEDGLDGCLRRAGQKFCDGNAMEALEWMDRATTLDGALPDAERAEHLLLAACLASLSGQARTAQIYTARAAQIVPADADAQYLLYRFSLDSSDYKTAADALSVYIERTGATERWQEAAEMYMTNGDYARSAQTYSLAMTAHGKTEELLYRRGLCLMLSGRYQAALGDLKKSSFPGSLYAQGVCLLSLGNAAEAAKQFEASLGKLEEAQQSRMMLAVCLLDLTDYARAETLLDEYVAQGGQVQEIAYYRAMARAMQGKYEDAIADYDVSAKDAAFEHDSLFGGAHCRYSAGRFDESAQAFRTCVEKGIRPAESWYYLGLSLMEIGETAEAEEALHTALAMGVDIQEATGGF